MSKPTLKLRRYQETAISEAERRLTEAGLEGLAFFVGLGLGKTVMSLSLFQRLKQQGIVRRALLLAPKRVCEITWPDEIDRWSNFSDLRFAQTAGATASQRTKMLADDHDICIATVDSATKWLKEYGNRLHKFPYDFLIADESSAFKTWGSKRTKALRKLRPAFERVLLLSATPRAGSVLDLFSQTYLMDQGKTFGKTVTRFKSKYGYQGGYQGYQWIPYEHSDAEINEAIAPLVIRLETTDQIDMPDLTYNTIYAELEGAVKKQYRQLEKEMWLEFENGEDLIPINAGVRYLACKQFTGGGVYQGESDSREVRRVHDTKLNLLMETIDCCQSPCLVAYQYQWECEAISALLKKAKYKFATINGSTDTKQSASAVKRWNEGKLDVLLCQPQGVSHGLNLQHGPGRDIIWFGLTDLPEVYEQFNGRVYRPGVSSGVRVHQLLVKGTVDPLIAKRLEGKAEGQKSMLDFLKQCYQASLSRNSARKDRGSTSGSLVQAV